MIPETKEKWRRKAVELGYEEPTLMDVVRGLVSSLLEIGRASCRERV